MDQSDSRPHMTRRGLLRTTGIVLAAGATGLVVASQAGCSTEQPAGDFHFLRPQDIPTLGALVLPVIGLPENTPKERVAAFIQQFDDRASALSTFAQKELQLLFNLLNITASRWFLTGSTRPLAEQPASDILAFLTDWRDSALSLKRKAYMAITRVILLTWYSDLDNTAHTGYPGPNAVIIQN